MAPTCARMAEALASFFLPPRSVKKGGCPRNGKTSDADSPFIIHRNSTSQPPIKKATRQQASKLLPQSKKLRIADELNV